MSMAALIMLLALMGHMAIMASPVHALSRSVPVERAAASHTASPQGSVAAGHGLAQELEQNAARSGTTAVPAIEPEPLPDCALLVAPAPRSASGAGSTGSSSQVYAPFVVPAAGVAGCRAPSSSASAPSPPGALRLHARLGRYLN